MLTFLMAKVGEWSTREEKRKERRQRAVVGGLIAWFIDPCFPASSATQTWGFKDFQ